MPNVLIIGSINQDVVVQTATFPQPGETIFGNTLQYFPGGKGANQAVACKYIHDQTLFYGMVGDDVFGEQLIKEMKRHDLSSHITVHSTAPTGTALIHVDQSGENMITIVCGANNEVKEEKISLSDSLGVGDFVILQNEIPQQENITILQHAKKIGVTTIYNPAPARPLDKDSLSLIDYLIVNEIEFEMVFGKSATHDTIENTAIEVSDQYGCIVVVTLGSQGVITIDDGKSLSLPAIDVTPTDTTGAGDCFAGTFTGCLASGESFEAAIHKSVIASGLSVTHNGASSSYHTKEEIEAYYKKHNNYC